MLLTSVSIDLADPNVRSTASMLALLWGVGVAAVLYSIFADIVCLQVTQVVPARSGSCIPSAHGSMKRRSVRGFRERRHSLMSAKML